MRLDYNGDDHTKSFVCDQLGCVNTDIAVRGQSLPTGWEFLPKVRGKVQRMHCTKCVATSKRVAAYRAEWKAWEAKCRLRRYGK
jgi:hypothetical protein